MESLKIYLENNPEKVEGIERAIEMRERLNTLKAGGYSHPTAQSIKEERQQLEEFKEEQKKLTA